MTKRKTIVDTWGDAVEVTQASGSVYLSNTRIRSSSGEALYVDFSYAPETARRLAKALKKAAKRAEADQ